MNTEKIQRFHKGVMEINGRETPVPKTWVKIHFSKGTAFVAAPTQAEAEALLPHFKAHSQGCFTWSERE